MGFISSLSQKTVIAVLDSLISPDWPNLPKKKQEEYEEQWHQVPDIPVRYQFYYNILDGDEHGRVPQNPDFNHRQLSCLQAICQSKRNKVSGSNNSCDLHFRLFFIVYFSYESQL